MRKLAAALLAFLLASAALAQTLVVPAQTNLNQIQASATGTTGQVTATLTGAAGRWTNLCGFVVTSAGTSSAAAVNVTVTGTGTTMNFTYNFVSSGQGVLGVALPACIQSSAVNTNIVVTVPGGGAGTTVAVTAWGYLS